MHGADVYEFFDMVFEGEEKEIFCPLHIDLQEFIGHAVRNRDDSRGMNEDDFFVLAFEKERAQGSRIGHVALDVFDVFGKFGDFGRKDESADFSPRSDNNRTMVFPRCPFAPVTTYNFFINITSFLQSVLIFRFKFIII